MADVTKARLSNGDLRKIHEYLNGDLRHIALYVNGDLIFMILPTVTEKKRLIQRVTP